MNKKEWLNIKKNSKKAKRLVIAILCALIPIGALGFGYFTGGDEKKDIQIANTLTVDGSIEVTTTRETEVSLAGIVPGDTINKTINIKPNATAESLMRVKIEPNWEGVSNPDTSNIKIVYADNVVKEDLNSSENNYWYKEEDYLYYIGKVTTQDAMQLVKGIKFLGVTNDEDANNYQGKNLKVNVTLEMIQCKYAPFKTKWTEVKQGTALYEKLIELCPEANTVVE